MVPICRGHIDDENPLHRAEATERMDNPNETDSLFEGKDVYDMDIDRMINEGLGGGQVTIHNGRIEETTTDTMEENWEK